MRPPENFPLWLLHWAGRPLQPAGKTDKAVARYNDLKFSAFSEEAAAEVLTAAPLVRP